MWNSIRSVNLSLVCTRVVMVLVVVCAAGLPWLIKRYSRFASEGFYQLDLLYPEMYTTAFITFLYAACVPAMAALICLDRLLANIKRDQVFTGKNVRLLRIISWCCFLAALLFAFAGRYYLVFLAAAVAAAFIGLILRVVKNVIEQAVELKAENDFTI